MSAAWEKLLHDDAQRRKLDAVAGVLVARFGGASEAVLRVQAAQLVNTAGTASQHVTRRADDAKAIRRVVAALRDAEEAMKDLSQPSREALYHRLYLERVWISLDQMAGIAESVGAALQATPFSSRENVRAIYLVDAARKIWAAHCEIEAPTAGLNSASPFAAFLADLFRALTVGAEPRSAFQAWRKYTKTGIF